MKKELHADGFCLLKNPSSLGGGFTVTDDLGVVLSRERIMKNNFTNNEAELLGVLKACELSEYEGIVVTDSMNTIFWTRKGKSKARPDLNEKIKRAKILIESKKLNLIWKKRDENLAGIYNENFGEEDEF